MDAMMSTLIVMAMLSQAPSHAKAPQPKQITAKADYSDVIARKKATRARRGAFAANQAAQERAQLQAMLRAQELERERLRQIALDSLSRRAPVSASAGVMAPRRETWSPPQRRPHRRASPRGGLFVRARIIRFY